MASIFEATAQTDQDSLASSVKSSDLLIKSLLFIALAIFAYSTWKLIALAQPDLFLNFPYMWPDSFDWVDNGTYYIRRFIWGQALDVPTIRQPLFSGLVMLAYYFETPSLLILCAQLSFLFSIFLTYRIAKHFKLEPLPLCVLLSALVFNHALNSFKVYLMSDQIGQMLMLGAFFLYLRSFIAGQLRFSSMTLAAATSALAGITQFYGLFPALIFSALLFGMGVWRRRVSLCSAAIFNLCACFSLEILWRLFKYIIYGDFGATGVSHFSLLQLSAGNLDFYSAVWPILFAPLIFFLIVSTPWLRPSKLKIPTWQSLYLSLVVLSFLVFVFLYQWQESRFTTFILPLGFLLIAVLVARLSSLPNSIWATMVFVLCVSYVSAVPLTDLMRPTIGAFRKSLFNPNTVWQENALRSLMQAKSNRRFINDPCLPIESPKAIPAGCDPYIYRNAGRYMEYLANISRRNS